MIKQYTTIMIDMYGVILEQSDGIKGYVLNTSTNDETERLRNILENTDLLKRLDLGEISASEFFAALGFEDAQRHIKQYIQNYLTLDEGFIPFAEKIKDKYNLVLLSNDVSEWSELVTEFYGLNKYFKHKTVSSEVKCRKPEFEIFDLTLENIGKRPAECIFVDDKVTNILAAEEVGISPILFNRNDEHYYGATVDSFDELYQLIG